MKKILVSLMAIALVIGLVGAGAFAYFSDVETSTGNTFTAGTLDLTAGSDFVAGTYSGAAANYVVTKGDNGVNGKVEFGTVAGGGIKPGESGTITWSLKNSGSIAGTLSIVSSYVSQEVSQNEPEIAAGDTPIASSTEGELDDQMVFGLSGGGISLTNQTIAQVVAALNAETEALASQGTVVYTLTWSFPSLSGTENNKAQSDTLGLDITFTLTQSS